MNGREPFQNLETRRETTPDLDQNESQRRDLSLQRYPRFRPVGPRLDTRRINERVESLGEGPGSSWSFGRAVLAIVPATTRYMAAALGAAAFSLRESFVDEPAVIDSDVKPVYDFEAAPASTLSKEWGGELPAATPCDTDIGDQLVETALTKTEQASETTLYLYDEEGDPLLGRDDLEAAINTDAGEAKCFWVVPGVVQRYTVDVPDGPKIQLSCDCRSFTTPHVFIRRGGAPLSVPDIARPIWVCSVCGRPTYGPEPVADGTNQAATSESIPGSDGKPIKATLPGGPAREHKQAITSYYERHGLYPWENGS